MAATSSLARRSFRVIQTSRNRYPVWQAVRIENLAITGENTWLSPQTAKLDTRYDDRGFLADGVTAPLHSWFRPRSRRCTSASEHQSGPAMQWNDLLHNDVIGEVARPVRDFRGAGLNLPPGPSRCPWTRHVPPEDSESSSRSKRGRRPSRQVADQASHGPPMWDHRSGS